VREGPLEEHAHKGQVREGPFNECTHKEEVGEGEVRVLKEHAREDLLE